jgi:hypothetical protein
MNEGKNYKNTLRNKRLLPSETFTVLSRLMRTMEDRMDIDSFYGGCNSDEGMIEGMVVWIMAMKGREEMAVTEEMRKEK